VSMLTINLYKMWLLFVSRQSLLILCNVKMKVVTKIQTSNDYVIAINVKSVFEIMTLIPETLHT
jgi:hypothetical protein